MTRAQQRDWLYLTSSQAVGASLTFEEFLRLTVVERHALLLEAEELIARVNEAQEAYSKQAREA